MSITRTFCRFFQQDSCLKGEDCKFLHIKICPSYLNGLCSDGSECRNAHIRPMLSRFAPSQQNPNVGSSSSSDDDNPGDQSICSLAAFGDCPHGENCDKLHGEQCPSCEKHCLHPFRPEEGKKHMELCEEKKKQFLEELKASEMVKCCVCQETVLKKTDPVDRKFGIQSDCDHSFCIACIKSWRYPNYPASGKPTRRACLVCGIPSHFLIPSDVWYFSKEKKQEIIDRYKENARLIECTHYRFGNGKCLFGDNCFYKHSVNPPMGNATPYLQVSHPVFVYVPDPYLQEQIANITETQMDTYSYPYHLSGSNPTAATSPDMTGVVDSAVYNYLAGTSLNELMSGASGYVPYTHVYSHEFAYLLDPYLHEELANMTGKKIETYTYSYPTNQGVYSNVLGAGSNTEASSSNVVGTGSNTEASSSNVVGTGSNTEASSSNVVGTGSNTEASSSNVVGTGSNTEASSSNVVGTGSNTEASSSNVVGIGSNTEASSKIVTDDWGVD